MRYGWFLLLLVTLLVGGCQTAPPRGEDVAGSLGSGGESSPADLYVQLSLAYLQEGDVATALKKIKYGLRQDEQNPRAHGVIAIIYERIGEYGPAERHFAEATRLDPQDPYILNAYGAFLCGRGEYARAVEQYELALRNPLYSTPEVALTNAAVCVRRQGDLGQAETYLRRALDRNRRYPPALGQMALVSFERGNQLSSRAYLQRYLALADASPEMLWLGVRVEHSLGDKKAAQEYAQLLRARFPDSLEVQKLQESMK